MFFFFTLEDMRIFTHFDCLLFLNYIRLLLVLLELALQGFAFEWQKIVYDAKMCAATKFWEVFVFGFIMLLRSWQRWLQLSCKTTEFASVKFVCFTTASAAWTPVQLRRVSILRAFLRGSEIMACVLNILCRFKGLEKTWVGAAPWSLIFSMCQCSYTPLTRKNSPTVRHLHCSPSLCTGAEEEKCGNIEDFSTSILRESRLSRAEGGVAWSVRSKATCNPAVVPQWEPSVCVQS